MPFRDYFIVASSSDPLAVTWTDVAAIRDPSTPLTAAQRASANEVLNGSVRLDQFSHIANVEDARAWLRKAQSITPAVIDAMPTARQQIQAVYDFWEAFANYFRAMNIRLYGWKRFRDAAEYAWGKPDRGNIAAGGNWRAQISRDSQRYDNLDSDYPVGFVTIGPQGNWRGGACSPVYTGVEDCTAPTGELHRLWLRSDARISGGRIMWPEEIAPLFNLHVCGTTQANPTAIIAAQPGQPLYQGWRCTARKIVEQGGAFSPEENLTNVWGLPSMKDYYDLVAPLVAYLATKEPLAFVQELRRDVIAKNAATALAEGVEPTALRGLAATRRDEDREAAQTRARLGFHTVGILKDAVGEASSVAGVIVGAVSAVGELLVALGGAALALYLDVFGRNEPTFEILAIVDSPATTGAYGLSPTEALNAVRDRIALPPIGSNGGANSTLSIALPTQSLTSQAFIPTATGVLEFQGITPGADVYLDGVKQPAGWWADAAQTVYGVNAPAGTHVVMVRNPDGTTAQTSVAVTQGATRRLTAMDFVTPVVVTPPPAETGVSGGAVVGGLAVLGLIGAGVYAARRKRG